MPSFLQVLESTERQEPTLAQAVANVKADIRSPDNPHGNLSPELVASIEDDCQDGKPVRQTMEGHFSTSKPHLHRRCIPSSQVRRVVPLSDFVSYHVLGGAADQSEIEPWLRHLRPGSRHRFDGGDLKGRTGRPGKPCWWCFAEEARQEPSDAGAYVEELALGEDPQRRARRDGAVVEVKLEAEVASDRYFKPTSLEGFGPNTPFRPELSGADHGRTVPRDSRFLGWPETVSPSVSYTDILNDPHTAETRVLPYGTGDS